MKTAIVLTLALVSALLLAGCTQQQDAPTPTPAPTAAPTIAPTATPEPTPEPTVDLSAEEAELEGIGGELSELEDLTAEIDDFGMGATEEDLENLG